MSKQILTTADIDAAETKDLVTWFNANRGDKPAVKKFADRKTAVARCTALLTGKVNGKPVAAPAAPKVSVRTTAAGATVVTRPAAGAPAPAAASRTKAPAAAEKTVSADKKEYRIGDAAKVKRGAIFEAVQKMAKRKTFTRADFVAACGGEVNSLSHFYWAKRHGVVVEA